MSPMIIPMIDATVVVHTNQPIVLPPNLASFLASAILANAEEIENSTRIGTIILRSLVKTVPIGASTAALSPSTKPRIRPTTTEMSSVSAKCSLIFFKIADIGFLLIVSLICNSEYLYVQIQKVVLWRLFRTAFRYPLNYL